MSEGVQMKVTAPAFPNRPLHMDACPGCGHPLGTHSFEGGCNYGWAWNDEGIATEDGCECPLTLSESFRPPRERDFN